MRSRKKGGSGKEARHIRLYHLMMKTPAWQSLSCVARCVYLEIEKRYGGLGSNNGKIHYSVRDGQTALHVCKTSIAKALKELQERGFIVCMIPGGFNRKNRRASEWRLTSHPSDISSDFSTNEFMRWQPEGSGCAPEIQNTVPLRGPDVPPGGQHGPSRRTEAA